MDLQGEFLGAIERVIVSPSAGVFTPVTDMPATVEVGSTLGFIHAGHLVSRVASDGERLAPHQRVAWLRAA
jgi:hypothetical protein